jgi:hypothetical protein
MAVSYADEFETVDVLLRSNAKTRGVDAFGLSLIKAERQIRRLVTHLIFQFPCFGPSDVPRLRQTLVNSYAKFHGFEAGFNALYPRRIADLIGRDYRRLDLRLKEATEYRNKILHGELPAIRLTRAGLLDYVTDIRSWCKALARAALQEFEYDGFGRLSFQKSVVPDLWKRLKVQITTMEEYETFVREHMQRRATAKGFMAGSRTELL